MWVLVAKSMGLGWRCWVNEYNLWSLPVDCLCHLTVEMGSMLHGVYGMSCSCLVQVQVRLRDGMVRNEHREPCAHSDVVLL